jgi:hypothetical protein
LFPFIKVGHPIGNRSYLAALAKIQHGVHADTLSLALADNLRRPEQTQGLFRLQIFCNSGTVVLSFIFDKF